MSREVDFSKFIEDAEADHGIDITMPDGTVIHVPPIELWPDDFDEIKGDVPRSEAILGEVQWKEYKAAGGTATALAKIIFAEQGVDAPESDASGDS